MTKSRTAPGGDSSESSSDKHAKIPAKIRWLHDNLPWRRFMIAEAVTLLGITVGVISVCLTIQQASMALTPPCESTTCESALSFSAVSLHKRIHPCENFYQYVCGNWPESKGASVAESVLTYKVENLDRLLTKIRVPVDKGVDLDALKKMALYYQSCKHALSAQASVSDGIQSTLSMLQLGWPDFQAFGNDLDKSIPHIVTMSLVYGFEMGVRLRTVKDDLFMEQSSSLMQMLKINERLLEDSIIRTVHAGQIPMISNVDLENLVEFDSSLGTLSKGRGNTWIGRSTADVFGKSRRLSVWKDAIAKVVSPSSLFRAGGVIYSRNLPGVENFTQAFIDLNPSTKSFWLYVHTVITAVEILTVQARATTTTNNVSSMEVSYCYEATSAHDFGFGLDVFASWSSVGFKGYAEVMKMVELHRARMGGIIRRTFQDDLVDIGLGMLTNVQVVFLLGAVAEGKELVERMYSATVVGKDFYKNRLSIAHPASKFIEQYWKCLERGGTLTFYSDDFLCIWSQAVFKPIYYGGGEPVINFPTLGFIVSVAFVNNFLNTIYYMREGTNQEVYDRVMRTQECLGNQYEALSHVQRLNASREEVAKGLLILSGALQLAYETVEATSKFKSNLERQLFFVRFCTMFCSVTPTKTYVEKSYFASVDMCNIVVRNVLPFYLAFQCFPEDYMGNTEVCRIF
ncbi:uncharacterized protein LOC135399465 [Ornithodoros turicata]|uniref:uncharacterized protein LOC135399465 n=1 Tax=Ornithodoros turicata TaxID=34597 RepID=UPI00313981DB